MHKGTMRCAMLAFGLASATLFGSAAMAADISRPVYKAPPAGVLPATYDWTGFYVGGHIGYGWSKNTFTDPFVPFSASGTNANGIMGGGQVGFNYQIGQFVLGVEGDMSGSGIKGGPSVLGATFNTNTDWTATLTGRAGLAFDRWLVYGKGGAAWASDKYSFTSVTPTLLPTFNGSETRWGWMVGAGLEYAFYDNWSAKIEYNYLGLRSNNLQFTDTTGQFFLNIGTQQQLHLVKAGLNYRWGWAPVGIRY